MADGSLARFLSRGSNQLLWLRVGLFLAGLNGAMAIMGLAIGFHGGAINPDWVLMDIEQAAQMQMIHALAILALAALVREFNCACMGIIMLIFLIGIICFCGGLYAAGFYHEELGVKIAPYGGAAFILGWLWIAAMGFKRARV